MKTEFPRLFFYFIMVVVVWLIGGWLVSGSFDSAGWWSMYKCFGLTMIIGAVVMWLLTLEHNKKNDEN